MVGHTQEVTRRDLQGEISERLSDGESVLAALDGAVVVPYLPEIVAHIGGDPPQPRLVVEGLGEGFRLTEVVEHLPEFSELPERIPQVEPEVDRLLHRDAALREMRKGCKACSKHATASRRAERANALAPACRQYATALSQSSPRKACWASRSTCSASRSAEPFDGVDNPGVQGSPPLLEQAAVGHLVGQGVLEGVCELREEAGFVEELGGLEVAEPAAQLLLGQLGDGLQQGEGHLRADDRGGLEQALLLGRQPIDARRQDRLDRRRHLQAVRGLARR